MSAFTVPAPRFIMMGVINRLAPSKLSAALAAGSFLLMIILIATTNPVDKLTYAMFFFLLLLIFLVALGHLLIYRWRGQISSKSRYRLIISSLFVVVLLMFRSSQSLGWAEVVVLAAVVVGLLFYSGRRA